MTSGMPELGSKISLISKADIRYEGRLFTVDPQECTIALASVRSYGTEDREAQFPVPAQNQVYDYILFRGSDIKDIRVVNNVPSHAQPLNDPAIMQLSVPPSLGGQQFQNHPVLGGMGPQMGFGAGGYGGLGGSMGTIGMQQHHVPSGSSRGQGSKPSELILSGVGGGGPSEQPSVLSPTVEPTRPNEHGSVLDLIGGGSRSTTPASLSSRKSPTNDQATQAGSSAPGGGKGDKKIVRPIQPPGLQRNQRKNSRERKDSRGDNRHNMNRGGNSGGNHHNTNYHHSQHQGYNHHHHQQQQQQHRGGGGWNNRGPIRQRGRPRGSGGGGTFKNNQGQPNQGNNKVKNTLKFENDYDFEQANTEFEELRSQLSKVKIDEGGSTSAKSEVNGDTDKKDDSGNETGAGEPEQEEDHEIYYDKTKSFFDKISCEAVERAKGKSQRTDWRTERKLNSETFGVSATRRGNYRGRGGFRGMGFRGGYRGAFRQPQRRDQQQQPHQQQQQQQQQGNHQQNEKTTTASAQNTDSSNNATASEKLSVVTDHPLPSSEPETNENSPSVPSSNEVQSVPEPAMAGGGEQIETKKTVI